MLQLAGFSSGAHGQLGLKIDQLQRRGAQGYVLDLRSNGGGLLDEAVLVSSLFVPQGEIVTTDGRKRPERIFNATGEAVTRKPVVVLVNGDTASASEIVTAALHECWALRWSGSVRSERESSARCSTSTTAARST